MRDLRQGLVGVELPGRFQVLPGRPAVILDVAHNPHAAGGLAQNLGAMGVFRRTLGVFAMLRDKDIAGVAQAVKGRIDDWFVAGIAHPRGASAADVARVLDEAGVAQVREFGSPAAAFAAAWESAGQNDRICVFGSFFTVADVVKHLQATTARRSG